MGNDMKTGSYEKRDFCRMSFGCHQIQIDFTLLTWARAKSYARSTLSSTANNRENQRFFGNHEAWTESNDTVFVIWRGDVHAEDIEVIGTLIQIIPITAKSLTLVQDVSAMKRFTPEARTRIIEEEGSKRLQVVIAVGANFHFRMLLMMVNRAMRLLHDDTALMLFCATLEQAHKLVEERRIAAK